MPGPVFGIRQRQNVSTNRTIQLVAQAAKGISNSLQQARRLEQREKEFKSKQADAQANLAVRESTLKLQQERLAFEQEREGKIEEERKSKQAGRTKRAAASDKAAQDRQTGLRISAFRALKTAQQSAVNNSVRAIDRELAKTTPLVQDPVADADLVEFEGMTAQQIAAQVGRRQSLFDAVAGDELKAEENPALVQTRQAALDAAKKALERRQGDFQIFAESQGHRFAPDQTVRGNLMNGFMNSIAADLGIEVQAAAEPSPNEKIERASEKTTTAPATEATTTEPQAAAPTTPEDTALAGRDLVQQFVAAADATDDTAVQALRQEANKLPDDAFLARYRELEAAVGTDRATALMLGNK